MKDSQHGALDTVPRFKYIKESNERFSTHLRAQDAGR